MKKNIKVLGCGVSGLSVAVTLLEAGYSVEIITEKLPQNTTSAKAAAIWFPYEVSPVEKANLWSKESYAKYLELQKIPDSGVSDVSITVLANASAAPWWFDSVPSGKVRKAEPAELIAGVSEGYVVNVPLAETQLYLEYLLDRFRSLDGRLTIKKVSSLTELQSPDSLIVNCAGLGSRDLTGDKELYPIHGQIVKVDPTIEARCIAADFLYGNSDGDVAYIVPRKDCIVLGGTAIKGIEDTTPNPEFTEGIIERCKVLEPRLKDVKIQSVSVGLRPGRSEIRLERVGDVIHNYGHGGGGFTVSWGCAYEVKRLIEN